MYFALILDKVLPKVYTGYRFEKNYNHNKYLYFEKIIKKQFKSNNLGVVF